MHGGPTVWFPYMYLPYREGLGTRLKSIKLWVWLHDFICNCSDVPRPLLEIWRKAGAFVWRVVNGKEGRREMIAVNVTSFICNYWLELRA